MKKFIGFEHGMGIGGWLTNYKRFNVIPQERRLRLTVGDFEHFATYITEADIRYIASLGMDHIRLGFDQIVLEEAPYLYREEIFRHIDNFISWCKKYGLNIVLNLHKAIGNYCDIKEEVELLDDEELQNRFISLWKAFEARYAGDNGIAFELLNELRDVDPEKWNVLAARTIAELRKLNPERKIIIGTTTWGSPKTLKDLRLYDDENVIYTFHFYFPFEFTHQRGVLQADQLYYNRIMPYPGDIERYRDYQRVVFGLSAYKRYTAMDITYLRHALSPAIEFVRQHPDKILWCGEEFVRQHPDKILWCGEFGTIRHADITWRENWMRDVISILKEHDIPFCSWNYLSTPNDGNRFSLVDDDHRKILSNNLANIIRGELG